jgi:hypothetical protein
MADFGMELETQRADNLEMVSKPGLRSPESALYRLSWK